MLIPKLEDGLLKNVHQSANLSRIQRLILQSNRHRAMRATFS